jgi:DNA-directed RNA polymerase specialized sigma24 family protein
LSSPPSPLSRDDERELVERAKYDPGAFGELYDRHVLQIYKFVYSRVRDQSIAEDVTSDVFLKALRSIGRYQDTAQRDELRRIWAVVETLPKQQRVAMVLKFQEDMKIEDIAGVMGKSSGAVKLLIHRGVMKVRQSVNHLDVGTGPDSQAWPGMET